MKKNETAKERLMDSLLKEDARGGADEEFLSELERAIDAAGEGGEQDKRWRGFSPSWAWGLAAAASVTVVAGYGFLTSRDTQSLARDGGTDSPATLRAFPAEEMRSEGSKKDAPLLVDSSNAENISSPLIARRTDPGEENQPLIARHDANISPAGEPLSIGAELPPRTPAAPGVAPTRGLRAKVAAITSGRGGERDAADAYRRYGDGGAGGGIPAEDAPRPEGLRPNFDQAPPVDRERYGQLVDQPWNTPWQAPLSTFSVDVDTASYSNIRRMLRNGEAIPKDAVRIEECINYFDYRYQVPQNGGPFAVHVDMASCPWQPTHHLVTIGLKGKEVGTNERPPSNLVFLIDVSGSMNQPNKLPLLVESMKVLVEELDERDSVGIVVYAGSAGTILEPTKVVANGRTEILSALDTLRAGGSTAGAAGLQGAYELAAKHYVKGGVNRVILATDGDFNVGTSSNGELVDLVKERAQSGVYLSVLGFGNGNLNDSMLEAITNDGNGNYFYIDTQREGRKVFLQNLSGTLVTIAKDVKIQVEFNPGKVVAYRLIGYANRILPPEAFNDDKIDAGDIGAGHTVTALYEAVPAGVEPPAIGGVDELKYQRPANRGPVDSPEWFTVKLRYKAPDGDKSTLMELPVKEDPVAWAQTSEDFQFAASVALFGEKLRQSDKIGDAAWEMVMELARKGSTHDPHGHRAEFLELVSLAGRLPIPPQPDPTPKLGQEAIGPDTLKVLKDLVVSHQQAGRPGMALTTQEQVLALSREIFGAEHPDTITAVESLAGFYKAAGRNEEALALLEEALKLSRK